MENSKRVRSCSRCGSNKILLVSMSLDNREVYSIECSNCGRRKSSVYSSVVQYTINDWNKRNQASRWTLLEDKEDEGQKGDEQK